MPAISAQNVSLGILAHVGILIQNCDANEERLGRIILIVVLSLVDLHFVTQFGKMKNIVCGKEAKREIILSVLFLDHAYFSLSKILF